MKYAVIFTATVKQFDDLYASTAADMRQRAMNQYGCTKFVACTEGNKEIAVSYWDSLEHIRAWKADAEHQVAQKMGQDAWYQHYRVEVVEVLRAYNSY